MGKLGNNYIRSVVAETLLSEITDEQIDTLAHMTDTRHVAWQLSDWLGRPIDVERDVLGYKGENIPT